LSWRGQGAPSKIELPLPDLPPPDIGTDLPPPGG
jgi:hypothetical protein